LKLKKLIVIVGMLFITLAVVSAFTVLSLESDQCEDCLPEGCTSILVGKDASTDGSTMVTHTCDCGVCDWTWYHVPAKDHKPGEKRKIYHISQYFTWPPEQGLKWERYKDNYADLEIPEVEHTYAFKHGMFGYMNEKQVALGESTIGCRRKMRNSTPSAKIDLTMLSILGMERARTAREIIQIMGDLACTYGYGFNDGGEMLAVADQDEVWIFEIMPVGPLWTPESGKPGAVWCAQRVPDNHVGVTPNESRIGEIDLDNKNYFMASENVKQVAIDMKFWDPNIGEPFNWKRAYSPSPGSAAGTQGRRGRIWRFLSLVAPSRNFSDQTEGMDFPFSVKPDKKLSVRDVMNITRDKLQGSKYDPVSGIKGGPFKNPNYYRGFKIDDKQYNGPRCICVNNVEYTTLIQCRSWLPDPIGGIIWLSFGAQDTACYMPIYNGSQDVPESFKIGDHWKFNRDAARWAFDYVDYHTQVIYSHAIEDVKKVQEKWEGGAVKNTPLIDKTAQKLYKQDPARALEFLTDYTINYANSVVKAWWDLGDFLLVKYNHFRFYDSKTRKTKRLRTPDWWNRAVVEQDKLEPLPQAKPKKK